VFPLLAAHAFYPLYRPQTPWPNRRRLKIALIKSIREGAFLDREYQTKHSKTGRILRPLYISSIVTGEKMSYINGLVKLYREGERLDVGSGPEDSDRESGLEQASQPILEEQVNEEDVLERDSLPVLTIGSFVSWRSLFFYLCTGAIQFAPLQSQGADARARYVREQTIPGRPPSCSPKAIYSLAAALDVKPLRDLAFDDIRSKVTPANVAAELFCGFTSRESEVMKMHYGLLNDKFREKSATASTAELIESMVDGKAAHRAGALKFVLRNTRPRGGVSLSCPVPK